MSSFAKSLAIVAVFSIAASASATNVVSYGPGSGGAIPDNNPGGIASDIVVTDSGPIQFLSVSVNGLTHTWIGDLIITLEHVGITGPTTLMHRVGQTGATSVGDSSNLGGNYTFEDGGADIWAAAAGGGTSFVVPGGTYSASAAWPASQPGVHSPISLNTTYMGENVQGTWRLRISDNAGADLGSFQSWSLNVKIPSPGAASLLGLAGLTAMRRRRA